MAYQGNLHYSNDTLSINVKPVKTYATKEIKHIKKVSTKKLKDTIAKIEIPEKE